MSFEKLISFLEERYYGDLIMAFFELIAIITGLILVRKDKTGIFFIAYLIFDFSILLIDYFILSSTFISKYRFNFFNNLSNTLISFVELLVYYHFFIKIIRNNMVIKVIKTLRVIFSIIIVSFMVTEFSFLTNRYSYVSLLIGAIEFLFLLFPCLIYFYELLKNAPTISLYRRPSFWIVTGICFYSGISIPYYLLNRFVFSNQYEYRYLMGLLFFNIPFILNFIFLTRAFLCKKTLTI